jgi:hypothetical protein
MNPNELCMVPSVRNLSPLDIESQKILIFKFLKKKPNKKQKKTNCQLKKKREPIKKKKKKKK